MKRTKKRSKLRATSLDRRQRKGKKLLSPFSKMGNVVTWTSWANDNLLNILWACVLAGSLERHHYLDLFRKIAIEARSALKDDKHASLCHNYMSTLDEHAFDRIFAPLFSDGDGRAVMQCLALIDGLPDIDHWRRSLPNIEPSQDLWDDLARSVFRCMDHQSQEATDARWLKVAFLAISGGLILPGGPDTAHDGDVVEELRLYPNHGDMRKVRPTIRAIESTIRSMETGAEKGKHVPEFNAEMIWDELFRKTECVLVAPNPPHAEDRRALVDELKVVVDKTIEHFFGSIATTSVDARMDASFGIALYSLSLIFELAHSPGRIFSSGRIILRAIAESFITLAYLRAKDDATVWLQFRNYGVGQTALAFLKTLKLDEIPDYLG